MSVQIGAKPDSGFDDPIGMLTDCHRRIERFLQILWVVARNAQGRALSPEELSAVQSALHYFRVGGQRHTADEEESLFPKLRASSPGAELENLERLESDHSNAKKLHEEVESLCVSWGADGSLNPESQNRLVAATQQLQQLYQEHIQLEEHLVFPLATQVLNRQTLATIGEEFRARRS